MFFLGSDGKGGAIQKGKEDDYSQPPPIIEARCV